MKKNNRLQRSDIVWGLAFISLIGLQFWWLPGEQGTTTDSYSNAIEGKLGLYRTLQQLFPEVTRETAKLHPDFPATLLIVAPDRYPNEIEEQSLYKFVVDGGTLLLAPAWGTPEFELASLGVKLERRNFFTADSSPAPQDSDAWWRFSKELDSTSPLVEGVLKWQAKAKLILPPWSDREELVLSGDGVEAAAWPLGSGRVLVCSSPDVFSNRSLLNPELRRLAVRLVEHLHQHHAIVDDASIDAASTEVPIVVNEFLNASDSYQHTGVLFSPVLRSGTLQLLALAILALWFGFHRFGPAVTSTLIQRRSLTDSARAVGNLQYRLQDGGTVIGNYLEYIRTQLGRRYGSAVRLDKPESLAARAGLDPEVVKHELQQATSLSKSAGVPAAQAAATLRWLALLHNRLSGNRTTEIPWN